MTALSITIDEAQRLIETYCAALAPDGGEQAAIERLCSHDWEHDPRGQMTASAQDEVDRILYPGLIGG